MRATFYPDDTFVRPSQAEQEYIHRKYIGELLKNQFLPETRTAILRIAHRMKDEEGIEALVLAGTELPLLLRNASTEIEFLDTTEIHVEAIVDQLLNTSRESPSSSGG
jgi:aspartate racemase